MSKYQATEAGNLSEWIMERRKRFEEAAQGLLDEARAEQATTQEERAELLGEAGGPRAEDSELNRQIDEIGRARSKMEAELAGLHGELAMPTWRDQGWIRSILCRMTGRNP
jgi:chromosome segregation ATPase